MGSPVNELSQYSNASELSNLLESDKFGIVSMKSYGAVADGVTDDTDKRDNAVNALKSNGGGILYMPIGTYLFSSKCTIDFSNIKIVGAGEGTIIKYTALDDLFYLDGTNLTDILFKNFTIQGNFADSVITGKSMINCLSTSTAKNINVKNLTFSGISVTNRCLNAIKFDGVTNGRIESCNFENMRGVISGTGYGVLLGGSDRIKIIKNDFTGDTGLGRHAVYLSAGTTNCIVAKNTSKNMNNSHITMNSTVLQDANANNIIANNICDSGASLQIGDAHIEIYGKSIGNKIIGNISLNSGQKGIIIDSVGLDSSLNEIENNFVYYASTIGIDVRGTNNVKLGTNTVHESSQSSVGTYPNIRIIADSTNTVGVDTILITGNKSTGTVNARSAIQFNSTVPIPVNIKMDGNYFPTCNLTSIENSASSIVVTDGAIRFVQGAVDIGSIASLARVTTSYTVSGALVGDVINVQLTTIVDGIIPFASCQTNGTVSVTWFNTTGGAIDLLSGTLYIDVFKRLA